MTRLFFVTLLILLSTSCALITRLGDNQRFNNADVINIERHKLIGKWYGEWRDKKGGKWRELSEISSDGTYRFSFLYVHANGTKQKEVMIGEWGLVGPVHFTISKVHEKNNKFYRINQGEEKNYEAYEVIALDSKKFRYRSYRSGKEYIVHKVGKDFTLPTNY
mgnify:CR=1 FL=1